MKQSIRDHRADIPNHLQKTASHSNPPTVAALAQAWRPLVAAQALPFVLAWRPLVAAQALPFVLAVAAAQRRMRAATLQ